MNAQDPQWLLTDSQFEFLRNVADFRTAQKAGLHWAAQARSKDVATAWRALAEGEFQPVTDVMELMDALTLMFRRATGSAVFQ